MSLQRQNALIKIGGRWCSLQLVRRWSKSVIQNTNAVISDKKWRETWIENTSNSFHNRSLWTDILHNSKNRLHWFTLEYPLIFFVDKLIVNTICNKTAIQQSLLVLHVFILNKASCYDWFAKYVKYLITTQTCFLSCSFFVDELMVNYAFCFCRL